MYKLGAHTDLKMPITKTAMAALGVVESYGRLEGVELLNGFNDQYGSCVPTAICNYVRITYARAGRTDPLTNQSCLDVYTAVTGFDKNNPATDNGTNPESMLAWFSNNPIGGATLRSFTRIDHTDESAIRNSIVKTGAVFLVVELAVEQQNQTEWFPVGNPGSWGGHGVASNSYSGPAYYIITWGNMMPADRSFIGTPGFIVGAYELEIILPAETTGISILDTEQVLARTLWGEARNQGKEGIQAVANVIVNRANNPGWYGTDIRSVCLAPWQFSSWNSNSPELPAMLAVDSSDENFQVCLNIADLAVKGILPDITKGSDSYYSLDDPLLAVTPPVWAKPELFKIQIGSQKFYRSLLAVK